MELKEFLNLFTAWHGDYLIPVAKKFIEEKRKQNEKKSKLINNVTNHLRVKNLLKYHY